MALLQRAIAELSDTASRSDDTERLVQALVDVHAILDELARGVRPSSGKDMILSVLMSSHPNWVSGDVLRSLSGIQEFARRIRELRVEDGYAIESSGGNYRLVSVEPDEEAARRWRVLNSAKRVKGSASDRLRGLFTDNVGVVFTSDELVYVADISEWARRVRELRESGYRIESHHDNPALRPGEYVLLDATRIPSRDRAVGAKQRTRILERDGYSCVLCGQAPSVERRIWLEVDHIEPVLDGGENTDENLRTLCNRCHHGRLERDGRS